MRTTRRFLRDTRWWWLGLAGLLGLPVLWGVAIEPYLLDVKEHEACVPGLPEPWAGQRVAVIADMQVGHRLANLRTSARAIERIMQERPALVLILGDFLYHPARDLSRQLQQLSEILSPLQQAGIPTYATFGNHDYGRRIGEDTVNLERAEQARRALAGMGVRVLKNEVVALPAPREAQPSGDASRQPSLYLVGIDAQHLDLDDPAGAVGQAPEGAPRIVMMHNPYSFPELPAGSAPFAVAGHTHGGQIQLPFQPLWKLATSGEERLMSDEGWIEGYGEPGNHLYINRGIGFSALPIRFNNPPELTLFTLQPGAAACVPASTE